MREKTKRKIDGQFYAWRVEMGNSEAMSRLRKSSAAVNVLMMFISKYTFPNKGKDLCITYREASKYMSASTFAKAKLWCMAFGFLYCTRFGRLERNASLYSLIEKWRYLSSQPEKLSHIEQLLKRHDQLSRKASNNIPEEIWKNSSEKNSPISAGAWKRQELRKIEIEILSQ